MHCIPDMPNISDSESRSSDCTFQAISNNLDHVTSEKRQTCSVRMYNEHAFKAFFRSITLHTRTIRSFEIFSCKPGILVVFGPASETGQAMHSDATGTPTLPFGSY